MPLPVLRLQNRLRDFRKGLIGKARTGGLRVWLLMLVGVMVWPVVPLAGSIGAARSDYNAGNYAAAAKSGEALATSEGYALAASALTAQAQFNADGTDREPLQRRAIELARKAIEFDSGNPDAHFQLARAMGRYSRSIGPGRTASEGYATAMKDALDTSLRLDPDNWEAELVLGTWHMEIVTKGGFLGSIAFGASRKKGACAFPESHRPATELHYCHV